MKNLNLPFLAVLTVSLFLSASAQAQQYFVKGTDTIKFRTLDYWVNVQGFITDIKYVDEQGKQVMIEGKKKLKDLQSIHYNTGIVQRMPLKLSKPHKYVRYGERVVNGKLQVHMYDGVHQSTTWVRSPIDSRMDGFSTGISGTWLFYLRLSDGTMIDLSKRKNMKKAVKPFLLQCEAFKNQYKGDFSMERNKIIEMIQLYNRVCST